MKECKYCGTIYEDRLKECPSCGATLVVSEKEKMIAQAQQESELQEARAEIEARKESAKPKMAPGKKLLIVMCSIAAVVAVIIAVVGFISNKPVTSDGKTNKELKEIYEQAETYMEIGDYEKVIATLDTIAPEYENYEDVTALREEAVEAYRDAMIAQAEDYVAIGKYEDALTTLTETAQKYGDAKKLLTKKDEMLYGYKQKVFSEVETYAATGDYSTAIKRLEALLASVGTDTDTEMKIQYYKKAQILKQAKFFEDMKDYVSAINYLREQSTSFGQEAELTAKLTELELLYKNTCIAEAKNYAEAGNYEQAIAVLKGTKGVLGNEEEISLLTLNYEKQRVLATAEDYIKEKNYEAGIKYLKTQIGILGKDTKLESKLSEITALHKETEMSSATSKAKSSKYAEAIAVLDALVTVIGSDADVTAKRQEYRKSEINQALANYDKSNDYYGAIAYMQKQSETKSDSDLKKKYDNYVAKYKEVLFAEAAKVYEEEEDYSAAVKVLNQGAALLSVDTEIKDKIAYYNNKKPVLLASLSPYMGEMKYDSDRDFFYAKRYSWSYSGDDDWAVYYINNEYETFQCKFVLLDADEGSGSRVVIYDYETGEGLCDEVLWELDIDGIEIRIDVSQVRFLAISLRDKCGYNEAGLRDAQLIKK